MGTTEKLRQTVKNLDDNGRTSVYIINSVNLLNVIINMLNNNNDFNLLLALSFVFIIIGIGLSEYPVSGVVPTDNRQLEKAARVRDRFDGSANYYDCLCVMPFTYRTIVKRFLGYWYGALISAVFFLALVIILSYSGEFVSITRVAFMLIMPVIILIAPFVFFRQNRTIKNSAATVLLIAAVTVMIIITMVQLIMAVTDNDVSFSEFMLPLPAQLIYTAVCVIVSELYICLGVLSKKKHYARNGELIKKVV